MSGVRRGKPGLMSGPRARAVHEKDPFSPAQLLVIEAALEEAWRRVRASALAIPSADEVKLNQALVSALHELLAAESVEGFTTAAFESPVRGGEVEDLTGTEPEKRPDIRLTPTGNPGHSKEFWALFVECKILDATHTLARYLSDGLARFIDERYAWAARHGMMLAYVRDGRDPIARIEAALMKDANRWSWVHPTRKPTGSRCLETIHRRATRENITVRHLALAG